MTRPEAPLAHRIGAEAAMGFLDLIRDDRLDRLKFCAADDCSDVLVDLSKNKSKRYCDTGQLREPDERRRLPRPEAGAPGVSASERAAVPPFAVMSILNRVADAARGGPRRDLPVRR